MPTDEEVEERLVNLEIRSAFQERTIEQLSSEIIRQQNQIDELERRNKEILKNFESGVVDGSVEKPPHY